MSVRGMGKDWTGKGLLFDIVACIKKWLPDDIARYKLYLEVIPKIEEEDPDMCRPDAREIDPMFEKALLELHPEL